MRLLTTPLSHFGRKVRILLDMYRIPYTVQGITGPNIAFVKSPVDAGDNPLMKIPVLFHEDKWLIESDHIASYVVSQFDSQDKYNVDSKDVFDLNARAIMNGVMNEEVKIIVAQRHEVPVGAYAYFDKSRAAVVNGLSWLDINAGKFDALNPKYREFHLTCCWDHLSYYDFVPEMETKYPRLREIVHAVSENAIVRGTAPHVLVPK